MVIGHEIPVTEKCAWVTPYNVSFSKPFYVRFSTLAMNEMNR